MDLVIKIPYFFDSFNGLRYPQVGGRRFCWGAEKNSKPEKCL